MKNLNLKALTCLFLGTAASATIFHPLDETKVIEVEISRQGLTRINVKEDRIINVFGVNGEYTLEADEDQGQVFIRPTGPGAFKPIHLTLTTEGGHTQDLRLIPKDQYPEALVLKAEENTENASLREKRDLVPITRDEIEVLMNACRENRIPLGYKLIPIDWRGVIPLDLKAPEHSHLIRALQGEKLRTLTFEVRNTSQTPLILSEQAFGKSRHTIAVWIEKKLIKPGEGTSIHVITRTH
ncbi:MAG: hypothetical protein BGO67_08525 [Alphaproteobacteria bacterium 41-28]|nr:MAG: hypothetical protein BGO67_08525 [Alphaproteobacteria bacterium 41-28]